MKNVKKKVRIIIGIVILAILLISVKVLFFPSPLSSRQAWAKWEKISQMDLKEQQDLWIEDIEYLAKNLEKRHKNLYHTISKEEFANEIENMKKNLNNLTSIGKFVELKSIVAKVGDGHTRISYDIPLNWFPITLQSFDDGIYVIECTSGYEEILGTRLVGINGTRVEDVIADMMKMISHDNEIDLLSEVEFNIRCADFLKYYNVIDRVESASFDFEKLTGERISVSLDSYYHKERPTDWLSIIDKYESINNILYTQNINDIYWYKYFEEDNLVYFQYNRCMEDKNRPIKEFISELLDFCKDNQVNKFVFDVRNNGGGNSRIIEPLIEGLARNELINQHGNLYVVIGESTYSSAILNTLKLKNETNAILIGKATGGRPNHYGEIKAFNLPNSGLTVWYSTKYFQHSDVDTDSIYPDIEVENSFEDFINGIDLVMKKILDEN